MTNQAGKPNRFKNDLSIGSLMVLTAVAVVLTYGVVYWITVAIVDALLPG
jgi:hypothetical protein